jgi:hypothetical protein
LVKREVGIIGTAVGVEILCLIISREGAKKREEGRKFAQYRSGRLRVCARGKKTAKFCAT